MLKKTKIILSILTFSTAGFFTGSYFIGYNDEVLEFQEAAIDLSVSTLKKTTKSMQRISKNLNESEEIAQEPPQKPRCPEPEKNSFIAFFRSSFNTLKQLVAEMPTPVYVCIGGVILILSARKFYHYFF